MRLRVDQNPDQDDHRPIDQHSVQHLVDFINTPSQEPVTELVFSNIELESDDSSLNVLRYFLARSNTTLRKITMIACDFGTAEEASQLLSAFQTNRTVTDLKISGRHRGRLRGAALGACHAELLRNNTTLQRFDCTWSDFGRGEGVRALQPGILSNRTLKKLDISGCSLGDEGMRIVAEALIGNRILRILGLSWNGITSVGLHDITRLIDSMQLKKLSLLGNDNIFKNDDARQHFVAALTRSTTVQEVQTNCEQPEEHITTVTNVCARNRCLYHVDLLLLPPRQHPPRRRNESNSTSMTMMLIQTWHKAITKFTMVPNSAGASAIFKLLRARPTILEKRLKRPPDAAAFSGQETSSSSMITVMVLLPQPQPRR